MSLLCQGRQKNRKGEESNYFCVTMADTNTMYVDFAVGYIFSMDTLNKIIPNNCALREKNTIQENI